MIRIYICHVIYVCVWIENDKGTTMAYLLLPIKASLTSAVFVWIACKTHTYTKDVSNSFKYELSEISCLKRDCFQLKKPCVNHRYNSIDGFLWRVQVKTFENRILPQCHITLYLLSLYLAYFNVNYISHFTYKNVRKLWNDRNFMERQLKFYKSAKFFGEKQQ